eukprot:scaffold181206_cov22-Tisochrysis_lutea.AAC.1
MEAKAAGSPLCQFVHNQAQAGAGGMGSALVVCHYEVLFWTRCRVMATLTDNSVRVWSAASGSLLHTFKGHTDQATLARKSTAPGFRLLHQMEQQSSKHSLCTNIGFLTFHHDPPAH